ncbi:MAG: glucosamine-6-phosphate deaminase, partial [Spirochaetae bacterium HGW-Spirochaetae-8]
VDWSKVTCFHLDEYVGISEAHPASFRKYLRERFVQRVGTVKTFHFINPDKDPQRECDRLGRRISAVHIDVAFLGIGENGHLAFNDPPADFATTASYIVVGLDHDCRMQQLGEGWFTTFDDVPSQAISMTISQIMKSKTIIATVPDTRKALAVKNAVEGPVSVMCPSSVMQNHADCTLFLDPASASSLKKKPKIE